jgi:DNA repair protein RadC
MYRFTTQYDSDRNIILKKRKVKNVASEVAERMLCKEDVYDLCVKQLHMDVLTEEYVYCFCLDAKGKVIGYFEASHGSISSSMVPVREIIQKCLLAGAVSFILAHNHPSGDPVPSAEDLAVTKRLVNAGEIIGIPISDHVIIGESRYCSMRELQLISST